MIAQTPPPPYYAVIFTSFKTKDDKGYSEMAELMIKLAQEQTGFLGIESARGNLGITVSYWRDLESIKKWKVNSDHQIAQEKGKTDWYSSSKVRTSEVEKDYDFKI